VIGLFLFWLFAQKAHLLPTVRMRERQDMHSTSFSNSIMGSGHCLERDLRNQMSVRIPMIRNRKDASAVLNMRGTISNQETIFHSIVYDRVELA